MATLEERVSALEESLARDFADPFRAVMLKVDDLGRDMREQGRDIREHGRDIREVKARLAVMDTRLNTLDEKIDSLQANAQVQDKKIDQILLLLNTLVSKPE